MNEELTMNTTLRRKAWFDEKELDIYSFKDKYVAEVMEPYIKRWSSQNPVFIIAPTGSGKNTFVENMLIPLAIKKNCKVLLVSNRVALNRQEKKRIAQITDCASYLEDYTEKGFDKLESFGNVDVVTYQKLNQYVHNPSNNLSHYYFVIFDECHFFYSDSAFNAQTSALLKLLPHFFKDSIRIYLTATPEEIMPYIIKSERTCITKIYNYYSCLSTPFAMMTYVFPKTPTAQYKVSYFYEWNEIITRIKKDLTADKWLLYVNSKKEGRYLEDCLGESSIFITSESKTSNNDDGFTYSYIVDNEKFLQKVLIATSVINNGINLKDNDLKNIVISTLDRTEFLQMIGRKRTDNNSEKTNLYYLAHSRQAITAKHNLSKKLIAAIQAFKNNPENGFDEYVHNNTEISPYFRSLLYYKGNEICFNAIGVDSWYKQRALYENLLESESVPEASVKLMLSWLSMEDDYSCENFLSSATKTGHRDELMNFFLAYENKPMLKYEQEDFCNKFKNLFEKTYGKRGTHLDRADRRYGISIIRKCLKDKELPFTIESIGSPTEWIVRKE